MKTFSEYKDEALKVLTGKWGICAIITIVYVIILQLPQFPIRFGVNAFSTSFNVLTILLLPLTYGFNVLFLDLYRGKKAEFANLFDGFKDYGRILGTVLLMVVYTFLWSLLLIIPGIIKQYSYSMTYFILKDNPELSNNAAIEKSMQMMNGNKMRLFLLDLSFIGWFILSCMTLGIGFLFLAPYNLTTHAAFYEDIKPKDVHSVEIVDEA